MATDDGENLKINEDQLTDADKLYDDAASKLDSTKMNEMLQKLQELRQRMSDGTLDPNDALKMLRNKRNTYVPTRNEIILFWVLIAIVVLVFGKHRVFNQMIFYQRFGDVNFEMICR